MQPIKIFIVEDDLFYNKLLSKYLSLNPDYEVHSFEKASDCLNNLHLNPDVISIDYDLPIMNGKELMEAIKRQNNEISIIIVSGQQDVKTAIDLYKAGADDYILKHDNTKEFLWKSILKLKEKKELKAEISDLKGELEKKFEVQRSIIGNSKKMQEVFSKLEKAINSNITVSITGETGTGKEVIAKAIHYNSDRKDKKFIAINMASIPKDLVESELFGYEKGAFTGADKRKIGKFEEAQGGTLFLDEIAEMDLYQQSKLLRVLQERELTRIGGNEVIKFDVRILIATHKNLMEEVKKGNFREDLYYRLIGLPIDLPPLRERENDVLLLSDYFIKEYCKANQLKTKSLTKGAKEKLRSYPFPGNIRELKAVLDLSCVMADDEITEDDINFFGLNIEPLITNDKTLREYNNEIISFYMKKYNNIVEVAKRLDIGKSTIYNLIKQKELSL